MHVRVLLFGGLREGVGEKELGVSLADGACVGDLRAVLRERQPAFAKLEGRARASVNREFSDDARGLAEGDEVAFLPPVSGGSGRRCSLHEGPLDEQAVTARVAGPDAGGLVTFAGAVRAHSHGHEIRHLEYEAYPEMALTEMEGICDLAAERWAGVRVAMAHRVGHLEIGDLAVVVAAAAPHRAEAFEACRFAIDTLKERVPIWKKEVARDGAWWVDDHP